jgi:serine/threonine protein kinase
MTTLQPLAANMLLHGRYRIIRAIGRGGMGAVYEAHDTRLGASVALKWLQPPPGASDLQTRVMLRAFEREARILARLRHAALPGVTDYFGDDDGQYLVMQYIPGDDLAELLARRKEPFAPAQVLAWADALLDVLEYLHGRRPPILHRDIKPQNLKLTPSDEIVLLDFGLARGVEELGGAAASGSSLVAYTPQYAPLEQIRGAAPDMRSDLYALAATLHHLLTGELPVGAVARMRAILDGRPDPLRPAHLLNPEVPDALGEALARAMAPLVENRPASAADLRATLRSAITPAGAAVPAPGAQRPTAPAAAPTLVFPATHVVWETRLPLPERCRELYLQVARAVNRSLAELRRRWSASSAK